MRYVTSSPRAADDIPKVEEEVQPSASPWRTYGIRAIYGLWGATMLVVCAYLLAGHLITLPLPAVDNPALTAAIRAQRAPNPSTWMATHVMYPECNCSRRIMDHLAERRPMPDVEERVLLIGRDPDVEAELRDNGWRVDIVTREYMAKTYQIEAAPILIVSDPGHVVRYAGGYTDRKQGANIRDLHIISGLQKGERQESLPLYGCAVSESLSKKIDPLSLR